MSIFAFKIAQFFLLLNYQLLPIILDKVSFDLKILFFFSNYLIGRKTKYLWNSFISSFFYVNIDIGQESVLSPIFLHFICFFFIFLKKN